MKRNYLRYLLVFITLSIAALALAGCTSSGSTATTATATTATAATTAGGAGAKNEISIQGNAFNPDSLTVKVGETVTWINNDSYAHTVTAKTGEFDSGNMASGAEFSFTFDKEGTIDYICGIHTFMTGKIVVTK
ncbi:MAG: cupredoxin family copper-binding protein [Actinobacteria bacterium]|nr:cupredoxin family copper-binding protein [Actinomycetota bacterium]